LPRPLQAVVNTMIAPDPTSRYDGFDDVFAAIDGRRSDLTLGDQPVEPTPLLSAA
jgi:hypothetical protein